MISDILPISYRLFNQSLLPARTDEYPGFIQLPRRSWSSAARRHAIYAMDDESTQGVFGLVGGNWNKNKICLPAKVGGEKNKKKSKLTKSYIISNGNDYLGGKCTDQIDWSNSFIDLFLACRRGKAEMPTFFLVGHDSSASESSSSIEYNVCRPKVIKGHLAAPLCGIIAL